MRFLLLLLLSFSLYAIDLQKAHIYDEKKHDIKNWYMSEKLDGIRAYWNGKELLSKNGNKIFAPSWFIANFPPFELDGELWTKRDDFENIQNIVLDTNPSLDWEKITYNIFEVPNTSGDFENRLNKLKTWQEKNPNKYIKIIPQIVCKDTSHLNSYLKELLNKKAEGIMLKNENHLLKVKTFFDDEALVINHNYKNKKFKSLVVRLKNGVVFNLGGGFSNEQRANPPQIGDIVTFKYYDLTKNGKPKFASFLRVRKKE